MNGLQIIRSYTMSLDALPEAVFPLLCPVREYDWIEPWSCEVIFTRSGFADETCVFQTNFPDDGGPDGGSRTWVVSRYEPPSRIEFVVTGDDTALHYAIALCPDGEGTEATWCQRYTALTAVGRDRLARFTAETHEAEMRTLERMLAHYLETGTRLALSML